MHNIWLSNVNLGIKILRQKLRIRLFGHPSRKRIKEYKMMLNSRFNNLEQFVFLNDIPSHNDGEFVEIATYKDDNLYAPCLKQLLWDHFKIHSEIIKYGTQHRIVISKGNIRRKLEIKQIKDYIISNLYHQFNLYRGSIPTVVCKFIREVEKIVTDFGIFEPQKGMRVYWTIDAEAQLAYVDNRKRMSTNIFSLKNKSALLLSETLRNISKSLNIPHTYFIPMELFDYNGKDPLGNPFCNIEENRKAVRELPEHASVAFHGYHHDEYRKLWSKGDLTEEYVENEIRKGKALANEAGIKMLPINRYPSLSREPFSLSVLEKNGFEIDTSDFIDDSTLGDFSAYCRYRLLKLEDEIIRPSKVWEIPIIYADPYVVDYNKGKIENLITYLKVGENYHNSEVALMFHDKIIGFPENEEIIFNIEDGRTNKTGNNEAIRYLQSNIIAEKLSSEFKTFNGTQKGERIKYEGERNNKQP